VSGVRTIVPYLSAFLLAHVCSSTLRAEGSITIPAIDEDAVREAVGRQWSIDYDKAKACQKVFTLRVDIAAGGVVRDVRSLDQSLSETDACKSVVEGAKRAVLKASPLPVTDDVHTIDINFDIAAVLE
jgi:hypothetical protein